MVVVSGGGGISGGGGGDSKNCSSCNRAPYESVLQYFPNYQIQIFSASSGYLLA